METREKILHAMFRDVHRNGFQGLRTERVIGDMKVTKGAFYHYFNSKDAVGLAIIDEIIEPNYLKFYRDLDIFDGNPIDMLQFHLKDLARIATDDDITLGCPLNNLVQEMTPIHDDFHTKLKGIVEKMHQSVAQSLERGKLRKFVKEEIDTEAVAYFYISGIEGSYGKAKVHRSADAFKLSMTQLSNYLQILRGRKK